MKNVPSNLGGSSEEANPPPPPALVKKELRLPPNLVFLVATPPKPSAPEPEPPVSQPPEPEPPVSPPPQEPEPPVSPPQETEPPVSPPPQEPEPMFMVVVDNTVEEEMEEHMEVDRKPVLEQEEQEDVVEIVEPSSSTPSQVSAGC